MLRLVGLPTGDTLDEVPFEVTVAVLLTLLDDMGDPLLLGAAARVMVVDWVGEVH
jgi:hypothetical protein